MLVKFGLACSGPVTRHGGGWSGTVWKTILRHGRPIIISFILFSPPLQEGTEDQQQPKVEGLGDRLRKKRNRTKRRTNPGYKKDSATPDTPQQQEELHDQKRQCIEVRFVFVS